MQIPRSHFCHTILSFLFLENTQKINKVDYCVPNTIIT